MKYKLKSGQINFEKVDQPGAYSCIVIRNCKFFNMTEDTKQLLLEALSGNDPEKEIVDLESMF